MRVSNRFAAAAVAAGAALCFAPGAASAQDGIDGASPVFTYVDPATYSEYQDADEPARETEGRRRFSAKLSAGAAVRGLYAEPVYGVDLLLGLGFKSAGPFSFYGTVGYTKAATRYGVGMHRLGVGCSVEWEVGRFHLGLAPQYGLLFVERVTSDRFMYGMGLGAEAITSVDLFRDDWGGGLFLELRGGGHYNGAPYYGGALGLGYRL